MKRCIDCKWDSLDGDQPPCDMCVQSNKYRRKWWKFWAPKVLLITLTLILGGCSTLDVTMPDGSHLRRTRFLDKERIGSVSYDKGSFTLDGYESDLTRALGIIDRLLVEYEEMFELQRMAVKP